MPDEPPYVSLWKVSRRGMGERHLLEGYRESDFPGAVGMIPDGCAYFAKDRWIAAEFATPRLDGYEDFVIETRIPSDNYADQFEEYEHMNVFGGKVGVELAVPADLLDELNRISVRLRVDAKAESHGD